MGLNVIIPCRLSGVQDLTKWQLSKKLVLAVNASLAKTGKCYICEKFYELNFNPATTVIRCRECSRPSHDNCTNGLLYLPKGFYWICSDCDDQAENKKIFMVLCNLRSLFDNGTDISNKHEEDLLVKPDVFQDMINDTKENVTENFADYDGEMKDDDLYNDEDAEDIVCYPQKVLLEMTNKYICR